MLRRDDDDRRAGGAAMMGRLLDRFRKPAAPPPIPPQPEAEKDWAIGDVAECISSGNWVDVWLRVPQAGPRLRQLLRVRDVFSEPSGLWLVFRDFPGCGYPAGHFRKLRAGSIEIKREAHRAIREPELVE
jgi:hypothetical protein